MATMTTHPRRLLVATNRLLLLVSLLLLSTTSGFSPATTSVKNAAANEATATSRVLSQLQMTNNSNNVVSSSRRTWLKQASLVVSSSAIITTTTLPQSSIAAQKKDLVDCLYTVLRVREATQQETRLITTGKFKDVQRANVKLAISFMLQNYRLADTFNTATSYISDNNKRVAASDAGQTVVQNLYTILEYFDASDVQNIKVGESAGKEELVLKGLESARKSIDGFLQYFPSDKIQEAIAKIQQENELNRKEFDPELGVILNPSPNEK